MFCFIEDEEFLGGGEGAAGFFVAVEVGVCGGLADEFAKRGVGVGGCEFNLRDKWDEFDGGFAGTSIVPFNVVARLPDSRNTSIVIAETVLKAVSFG